MIRLIFSFLHMLGGLVVKLLVLIVINNLLYDYFTGQAWNIPALMSFEGLPDKLIWNIRALTPMVETWADVIKETGEPVLRHLMVVIRDWTNNNG